MPKSKLPGVWIAEKRAAAKFAHYVIGECVRCKRLVTGHLLRGQQPDPHFYPNCITVVGRRGSRHAVHYPIDAMQRGRKIAAKEDCQNR